MKTAGCILTTTDSRVTLIIHSSSKENSLGTAAKSRPLYFIHSTELPDEYEPPTLYSLKALRQKPTVLNMLSHNIKTMQTIGIIKAF
ncbi:hypothetical protein Osc1_22260 [Hominimerdicola sp. 21CYCFAH17_S]